MRWAGEDDADGSGVAGYDVYVSIDGGPFALWLEATTLTEADFTGEAGHTYAFYSVARDNVGHAEYAPATPDAEVTVLAAPAARPPALGANVKRKEVAEPLAGLDALAISLADKGSRAFEQRGTVLVPSKRGASDRQLVDEIFRQLGAARANEPHPFPDDLHGGTGPREDAADEWGFFDGFAEDADV